MTAHWIWKAAASVALGAGVVIACTVRTGAPAPETVASTASALSALTTGTAFAHVTTGPLSGMGTCGGPSTGDAGALITHADALSLPLVNFEGADFTNSCNTYAPPSLACCSPPKDAGAPCPCGNNPTDDSGAIGRNHFVQTTNFAISVYSRTGTLLAGPVWTGALFGGISQCSQWWTDATVIYDQYADRWVISRFAKDAGRNWNQCFAVSQTPDPTGTYDLYGFQMSACTANCSVPGQPGNALFPDFDKIGVWGDAYYMTSYANGISSGSGTFVTAFDRSKMLAGAASPGIVNFLLPPPLPPPAFTRGGMLPAFVDGPNLPPSGSPNFLAQVQDDDLGYPADRIQIYEAHVDWQNPSASSLNATTTLTPADFHSGVCRSSPFVSNCLPQPGANTSVFDPLVAGPAYRLIYRNFGDHEAMVFNHTIAANDDDGGTPVHSAIRWYEMRRQGGPWSIFQQGTHVPDANNRWVGSMGMDGKGNIALGYAVASTTVYPSIRYAGRLATDTPGTLPELERSLAEGQGSLLATGGNLNYADYSEMTMDPVDDCTFWLTNSYVPATSSTNDWHTRIGSFRFNSCIPRYQVPKAGRFWLLFPTGVGADCSSSLCTIFHVGADTTFYARTLQGGSWTSPVALTSTGFAPAGASGAASPQTASQSDGFVVGNDGKLYTTSSTSNGPWQSPTPLTSASFAPPGASLATATQGGQLGVAVVDNSGKLEITWWNPVLGWLGPVAVTGANYAPPGAGVIIGRRASGELDAFSIGTDGALKYMAFSGGSWSGPWPLTLGNFAPPGGSVAAAVDLHGFLNVLTIANDGALYTKWDCTSFWCGATALTATGFAPPGGNVSAINFNNHSINAFLVDKTGALDVLSNGGFGWQGPTVIAANVAQPGAAVGAGIQGPNQLDLFAVATASPSGLVESINTGAGWSAPVALP